MRKTTILKTMLLAVMVLGGANCAWAEQVKVTLYSQDYSSGTSNNETLSDWSAFSNSSAQWDSSSKFAKLNATANNSRGFLYSNFNISDDSFTDITTYYVEFDFGYYNSSTSNINQTSQLIITTTKSTSPTNFGSHNTSYTGNERLFSLYTTTSSANQDPSTFYVNQTSATGETTFTVARPSACTHHVKLTVDRSARTVTAVITLLSDDSQVASDAYNLEEGVDTKITGMWLALGANWSRLYLDNTEVYYMATKLVAPTITPSFDRTNLGYAYAFSSTQEVGTPVVQYNYTYTPTVGEVVNGTAASYTPTTPGTLSVVTSLVTSSNLYVSSDATETTSLNPYVKVATWDFTTKNVLNKIDYPNKTTDLNVPGFTTSVASGDRNQISTDYTANKHVTNLNIKNGLFNIYEGYGLGNQDASDYSVYYAGYVSGTDMLFESTYKQGDSESSKVWGSTDDSYEYRTYVNESGTKYKIKFEQKTSYKIYTALNMYAPLSTAKVQATIGEAGYATFSAPCALDFSGVSGLTAYTAALNGDKTAVVLTQVNDVPAGTGVILQGDAGAYTIPATASSTTDQGALTAILVRTVPANGNNYVLSKEGGVVGFYKLPDDKAVQACRAYLTVPTSARMISIVKENDAMGISELKTNTSSDNAYYTLGGVRVAQPSKGLYVKNGKKVVVK